MRFQCPVLPLDGNEEVLSKVDKNSSKLKKKEIIIAPKNECRIILYTSRKIFKGEQLLFDYNQGCDRKDDDELSYNTSGFI